MCILLAAVGSSCLLTCIRSRKGTFFHHVTVNVDLLPWVTTLT